MATDIATRDAVEDVFNADFFSDLDDDPFSDKPKAKKNLATLSPRSFLKRKANDYDDKENTGLGLDEEVKIVKKRQPIAKLDEARLLSEPGIPVLRKLIREKRISRKLKLKGKGHEFTDAARLLNYFQLWLDNLYPRAKFADALQLTEKAGHSKRMHMVRNEWINEGKPGYIRPGSTSVDIEVTPEEMPDLFGPSNDNPTSTTTQERQDAEAGQQEPDFEQDLANDSLFIPDANKTGQEHSNNDNEPEEDELDALRAMQDDYQLPEQPTRQQIAASESEGEDDLDALLAEQDARSKAVRSDLPLTLNSDALYEDQVPDLDLDDLDALMASQESRRQDQDHIQTSGKDDSQPHSIPADLDDEDAEDDLTVGTAAAKSRPPVGEVHGTHSEARDQNSRLSKEGDANVVVDGEDSQLTEIAETNES